tara:strand:+ start:1377 stop:2165 length:789 start_codon:yes stop_codon:yes gene_type:complete
MTIKLLPVHEKDCWSGATWVVEDEKFLIELIARVAIGQSRVVERILRATGDLPPGFPKGGFEGAKKLLFADPGGDPYHRDGWIFQIISWIAAHIENNNSQICAPHMIHAHKGFDGLMVEFDDEGIAYVIISEDKATGKPRSMVRDKVWPEFMEMETGKRDNELIASVTSLLAISGEPNPDAAVASILWGDKRAYRVAVTVGDQHSTKEGRKKLYKGYEAVVSGDVGKRRAATLHIPNIRTWFSQIAEKASEVIDAEEAKSLV